MLRRLHQEGRTGEDLLWVSKTLGGREPSMGEYNCWVGEDLLWLSTTVGWEWTFYG